MRIAIVGAGYVADFYAATLPLHPHVEVAGVWDRDPERLAAYTGFHGFRAYDSMEQVLADDTVAMVVNLTNPSSHHEVSSRALDAGKHVYSEKPLTLTMADAHDLAERAERNGVVLSGAPCNQLGEHVEHLRDTLRERSGDLGRPLLVHAEMDDGMIPTLRPETWRSASGAPWPVRDEFEMGATLEHAGYQIGPLVSLFGPVRAVTAFTTALLPDKIEPYGGTLVSPDLSVGMLEFDNGVVARLTCSIIAPADRSLRVVCEHGVLTLADVWEYDTPLRHASTGPSLRQRLTRRVERQFLHPVAPSVVLARKVRPSRDKRRRTADGAKKPQLIHEMDFARGIAQVVDQIERGAPTRLDAAFALHVTEVTLALASPTAAAAGRVEMTTAAALDARS